jgi:hypothetical protein
MEPTSLGKYPALYLGALYHSSLLIIKTDAEGCSLVSPGLCFAEPQKPPVPGGFCGQGGLSG